MAGKDRKVEVSTATTRWVATELAGKITIHRGGVKAGAAVWQDDQLVHSTVVGMPDEVVFKLEKLLKEQIDKDWEEG